MKPSAALLLDFLDVASIIPMKSSIRISDNNISLQRSGFTCDISHSHGAYTVRVYSDIALYVSHYFDFDNVLPLLSFSFDGLFNDGESNLGEGQS